MLAEDIINYSFFWNDVSTSYIKNVLICLPLIIFLAELGQIPPSISQNCGIVIKSGYLRNFFLNSFFFHIILLKGIVNGGELSYNI